MTSTPAPGSDDTSPSRADQTKEALIAAALSLVAERGAGSVSVRDIARLAGVNHGLVHRYFGSKDGLLREAVLRNTEVLNERILTAHRDSGYTLLAYEILRERPDLAKVGARCCLDGPQDLLDLAAPSAERLERGVEPVRRLLANLGAGEQLSPYVLNALGCAALLGWFIFRPLLERGYNLPPDADDQVGRIASFLDALMAGGDLGPPGGSVEA